MKALVVERYYVSDTLDSSVSLIPNLPAGSVTYRIFVDMQKGYRFQAVFGSKGHPMRIATSTSFYNHPVHGNNLGNLIYDASLPSSTVMLDSWISVGAASTVHLGVMKADDDTVGNIANKRLALSNADVSAGIPLTEKDGLKRIRLGSEMPRVTALNIDTLLYELKNPASIPSGYVFETENGSWACIGGSANESDKSNRVLIGQFTTSGDFTFSLNLQLGKPGGGYEQYVAEKPFGGQMTSPSLKFSSR
ncbi:MAG: hypothetical protein ACU4F9_06665 [Arcticibacter sp.]